jgi:hypothetical protein
MVGAVCTAGMGGLLGGLPRLICLGVVATAHGRP